MFNRKIGTISWKIHRPYEGMAIGGGTPTYTKEVTGNGYIDLTDAVANKLLELKAYGGCTQASTPTPTTPVDIVCNNGTLKVKKESGLPFRYKKVEYITASGTQWLNTGVKLASTDIVEAEYKNSSTTGYGALYGVFAMGQSSAFYANGTYYGYDVSNNKVDTGVSVDTSRHTSRHDFVNGIITLDDTTTTFTTFTFDNSKDNYLFSRYYNNSYGYGFKGSCRKYRIYRGGELICDLVPVIDTQNNNEPGMYDLVSGEFKGNVGSGDFTAGAEAQDDVEVYVQGTKEKIGINMVSDIVQNAFVRAANASEERPLGSENYNATFSCSGYIKVEPNTEYTTVADVYQSATGAGLVFFESNTVESAIRGVSTNRQGGAVYTFTTPANCHYVRFSWDDRGGARMNKTNNTATCEDLLGVGDYKDEQEILSGDVIIKCGVAVLDGTENWTQTGSGSGYVKFGTEDVKNATGGQDSLGYSTHYNCAYANTPGNFYWSANLNSLQIITESGTTLSDFKTFLANQLSAGTPVIVVYPLATPTTLSVAGQSLSIPAGNSRIEIVEGSILDLPLYAKYKSTTE